MAFQGRMTVFFSDGTYGWTETLYNAALTYGQLTDAANAYMIPRQNLLATGAKIIGWRVSDDNVFRDSIVQFFQPPLAGNRIGVVNSDCLPSFVACLLRLVATPLARRAIYIRGIPINIVDDFNTYTPTPGWLAAVQTYRKFLSGSTWQVKSRLGSNLKVPIDTLVPPNLFHTTVPHLFNVGAVVNVLGSSRNRNPVGVHKVSAVGSAQTFSLAKVDLPADYLYVPLALSVQAVTYTFATILDVQDERITRRATGRPFGVPRGRRSPVKV